MDDTNSIKDKDMDETGKMSHEGTGNENTGGSQGNMSKGGKSKMANDQEGMEEEENTDQNA